MEVEVLLQFLLKQFTNSNYFFKPYKRLIFFVSRFFISVSVYLIVYTCNLAANMKLKQTVLLIILFGTSMIGFSQDYSYGEYDEDTTPIDTSILLSKYVDTLNAIGDTLLESSNFDRRISAAYGIIPRLVEALQYDWTMLPHLDSLERISVIRSPDDQVRIFSWQLNLSNGRARHFGAIQKKNKDSLELYPLFDASDFLPTIEDTLLYSDEWYGCLYYNIIQREIEGKDIYFLFGFDVKDNGSNIKLIEVLEFFPEEELIRFGKQIWYHTRQGWVRENVNWKKPDKPIIPFRFMLEYIEPSVVSLNWDASKTAIIYDQIEPLNENSWDIKATYCPTGKYESLVFDKGKWLPKGKVFNFVSPEAPLPTPVPTERMQTLIPKERMDMDKNRSKEAKERNAQKEKEQSESKPK